MVAYPFWLFVCLATTNQPDTPLFFNCLNTRFGYNSEISGIKQSGKGNLVETERDDVDIHQVEQDGADNTVSVKK